MASYHAPQDWKDWSEWIAAGLHGRARWRLAPLILGLLFGQGRRVVAAWIRAAGLSDDYQDYYYFLQSVGLRWHELGRRVLVLVLDQILSDTPRVLLAIDVNVENGTQLFVAVGTTRMTAEGFPSRWRLFPIHNLSVPSSFSIGAGTSMPVCRADENTRHPRFRRPSGFLPPAFALFARFAVALIRLRPRTVLGAWCLCVLSWFAKSGALSQTAFRGFRLFRGS